MESTGGERRYFVPRWYVKAAYAAAALQVALAGIAYAAGVGHLALVFLVGAGLVGYQGYWTATTPIARLDDEGIGLRPALLAKPRHIRFSEIRSVSTVDGLFLQFDLGTDRDPRIPLTALSERDARELLATLREKIGAG